MQTYLEMADFKLRFISDSWVARPQFRLGDMRVPIRCVFGIEIGLQLPLFLYITVQHI